jgi:hypothetical protein
MQSSTETSSNSVELRVFSFCLVEVTMRNPRPIVRPPPVCPRIPGCTAKDPSTHHSKMPVPEALSTSGRVFVPLRYLIMWDSFFQSSVSGYLTLVVRYATAVQVSGLARLVA